MTEKRYVVLGVTGLELGPDWGGLMAESEANLTAALTADYA